jgi:uncharacterized protein involved in copper resistance
MKSILVSALIIMSSQFAFSEEPKTATTPEAPEHTMGAAHGKMQASMGAKHEEMLKMCKEHHPDMDCEKMMGHCGGQKDMTKCMDKMATMMKK